MVACGLGLAAHAALMTIIERSTISLIDPRASAVPGHLAWSRLAPGVSVGSCLEKQLDGPQPGTGRHSAPKAERVAAKSRRVGGAPDAQGRDAREAGRDSRPNQNELPGSCVAAGNERCDWTIFHPSP